MRSIYRKHEVDQLIRDYAALRGYHGKHGWIYNRHGRKIAKGWDGFRAYILPHLDFVEADGERLYLLDDD